MSEDQVTHMPWSFKDSYIWQPWDGAVEINCADETILWTAAWGDDPDKARRIAEQAVLAVNSHDALTARVAELESENERLRGLVDKCRSQFNLLGKMATVKTIYVVVNGERVRKRKEDVISLECSVAVEKIDAALKPEG